jgi:hypothetical protein
MPLLRTAMYAKGVRIYLAPTLDHRRLAMLVEAYRVERPLLRAGVQPVYAEKRLSDEFPCKTSSTTSPTFC